MPRRLKYFEEAFDLVDRVEAARSEVSRARIHIEEVQRTHWKGNDRNGEPMFDEPAHPHVLTARDKVEQASRLLAEAATELVLHAQTLPGRPQQGENHG